MTLYDDALSAGDTATRAVIDGREAELVSRVSAAENMAATYLKGKEAAEALLKTALARIAEIENKDRIPVDLTSAVGWTVQDRSSGTQSNDASVNLRENTLFTSGGLRILGTQLAAPISNRAFGSGDVLGKHITVPNYFHAEVDAVLPTVPGSWPCPLWFRPLGGSGDLSAGEIDVVETWPHAWANGAMGWAAIHPEYNSTTAKKANAGLAYAKLPNPDPVALHTYTVEKTPGRIAFWYDDVLVYEWKKGSLNTNVAAWWDRIFEVPDRTWYPRITLQVGGPQTGGYPKAPWSGCEMLVTDIRIRRL